MNKKERKRRGIEREKNKIERQRVTGGRDIERYRERERVTVTIIKDREETEGAIEREREMDEDRQKHR